MKKRTDKNAVLIEKDNFCYTIHSPSLLHYYSFTPVLFFLVIASQLVFHPMRSMLD